MTLRYKILTLASVTAIQIASLTVPTPVNASSILIDNFEHQGYSRAVARALAGIHPNYIPAKMITRKEEADVLGEVDFLQHRANKANGRSTLESLQLLLAMPSATPDQVRELARRRNLDHLLGPVPFMGPILPIGPILFAPAPVAPAPLEGMDLLLVNDLGYDIDDLTDELRNALLQLAFLNVDLPVESIRNWIDMPADGDQDHKRALVVLDFDYTDPNNLLACRALEGKRPLTAHNIQEYLNIVGENQAVDRALFAEGSALDRINHILYEAGVERTIEHREAARALDEDHSALQVSAASINGWLAIGGNYQKEDRALFVLGINRTNNESTNNERRAAYTAFKAQNLPFTKADINAWAGIEGENQRMWRAFFVMKLNHTNQAFVEAYTFMCARGLTDAQINADLVRYISTLSSRERNELNQDLLMSLGQAKTDEEREELLSLHVAPYVDQHETKSKTPRVALDSPDSELYETKKQEKHREIEDSGQTGQLLADPVEAGPVETARAELAKKLQGQEILKTTIDFLADIPGVDVDRLLAVPQVYIQALENPKSIGEFMIADNVRVIIPRFIQAGKYDATPEQINAARPFSSEQHILKLDAYIQSLIEAERLASEDAGDGQKESEENTDDVSAL